MRARLAARRALEQRGELRRGGPPATSSIVPTSTRFMWRMNVSASIQNSSTSPARSQRRPGDVALEALVVGVGRREGGEVVRAGQRAAQACSASSSSGCGHHSARPRSNGDGCVRAPARGRRRCAMRASWRAEKPSGIASAASTAISAGSTALTRAQSGGGALVGARPAPARARRGRCGRPRSARPARAARVASAASSSPGHRPLGRAARPSPRRGRRRTRQL